MGDYENELILRMPDPRSPAFASAGHKAIGQIWKVPGADFMFTKPPSAYKGNGFVAKLARKAKPLSGKRLEAAQKKIHRARKGVKKEIAEEKKLNAAIRAAKANKTLTPVQGKLLKKHGVKVAQIGHKKAAAKKRKRAAAKKRPSPKVGKRK